MYITLRIHDREKPLEALPVSETMALIKSYGKSGDAKAHQLLIADRALSKLKTDGHWLACSCLGAGVDPPILVPAMGPNAVGHTLRRMPSIGHHELCPFHSGEVRANETLVSISGLDVTGKPSASWNDLLAEYQSNGPSTAMLPVMTSAAIGALTRCHYFSITSGQLATRDQGLSVSDLFAHYKKLNLLHEELVGEHTFSSIGSTFAGDVLNYCRKELPDIAKGSNESVLGIFPVIASGVRKIAGGVWIIECRIGSRLIELALDGEISLSLSSNEGPFFVVLYAAQDEHHHFQIRGAAGVPLLSRKLLFPVLNSHERAVASVLMDQLRYWSTRFPQAEFEIRKPHNGVSLSPGFIISGANMTNIHVGGENPALIIPASLTDAEGEMEWRKQLTACLHKAMQKETFV